MYAGVEQSTDMRDLCTKVVFFRKEKDALKWLRVKRSGELLYANPAAARNGHRWFRQLYRLPAGWRRPSKKMLTSWCNTNGTPTYRRDESDALASMVRSAGEDYDPGVSW